MSGVEIKLKGAPNINLTQLLYIKQNFKCFEFFATNLNILLFLDRKIFVFIFPLSVAFLLFQKYF